VLVRCLCNDRVLPLGSSRQMGHSHGEGAVVRASAPFGVAQNGAGNQLRLVGLSCVALVRSLLGSESGVGLERCCAYALGRWTMLVVLRR
jgi:hypothetical protein